MNVEIIYSFFKVTNCHRRCKKKNTKMSTNVPLCISDLYLFYI